VPVSIEAIPPERTFVIVSHVITFAINAFKRMRAWKALSSFEMRGVEFRVSFATLC